MAIPPSYITPPGSPQFVPIQPHAFSEAEDLATIAFYQALSSAYSGGSQIFLSFEHLSQQDQAAAIREQLDHYDLGAIRQLVLSNRELTVVPPEIALCQGLAELDLSHNQIHSLPSNLDLPSLQILRLSYNLLSVLPLWVFRLPRISNLFLDNNLFTLERISQIQNFFEQHVPARRQISIFTDLVLPLTMPESVTTPDRQQSNTPRHPSAISRRSGAPRRYRPYSAPLSTAQLVTRTFESQLELWNIQHLNRFHVPIRFESLLILRDTPFKVLFNTYLKNLSTTLSENSENFGDTVRYVREIVERAAADPEFLQQIINALARLEDQITRWETEHNQHYSSSFPHTNALNAITIRETQLLGDYLLRLRELPDYREGDAAIVIQRVGNMLSLASSNLEFKKEILAVIADGLKSGSGRLLSSFNDIEIFCQAYQPNLTKEQIHTLSLGQGRYEWVKKLAIESAARHLNSREEIQTAVFFQAFLRRRLSLPISTKRSLFPNCSVVYPDPIDEVAEKIQGLAPNALLALSSIWLNWQKKQHPIAVKQIEEQYAGLLSPAEELCKKPSQDRVSCLQACDNPLLISILRPLFENESQTLYAQAEKLITEECNEQAARTPQEIKAIKELHTRLLAQAHVLCNYPPQERGRRLQELGDQNLNSLFRSLFENNSALLYKQASQLISDARVRAIAAISE